MVDPACYTIRDPALCDNVNLGFFLRNGKAALNQRAIFSEFFLTENINALAEPTYKIIEKGFSEQVVKLGIKSDRFIQIDIREMMMPILKSIIS